MDALGRRKASHYDMTVGKSVKARTRPSLVAVIASGAAFGRARQLSVPAHFFELRLDALYPILPEVGRTLEELRAPLIITARHPLEGGINNLSPSHRRDLLLRYLPKATYVDIELRSAAELRPVLQAAKELAVKLIISVHEMDRALEAQRFKKFLESAQTHSADIFKIVTRTENADDVTRLVEFFDQHKNQIAISAMGAGRMGGKARLKLARSGSVLNYVHLGTARVEGQMSLAEMRRQLNDA